MKKLCCAFVQNPQFHYHEGHFTIDSMSKFTKIILGVLSVWPVLYYGIFTQVILPGLAEQGFSWEAMKGMLLPHLATVLLCMVLFFYYLVKVLRNKELGENRTWWILGIIFLNAAAWPVYLYLYIWKKHD